MICAMVLIYSSYPCITAAYKQGVFHTAARRRLPPSMTVGTESGVDDATKLESTSKMRFNAAFVVLRMVTASKGEWVKFILDILSQVIAGLTKSKHPVQRMLLIDNQ